MKDMMTWTCRACTLPCVVLIWYDSRFPMNRPEKCPLEGNKTGNTTPNWVVDEERELRVGIELEEEADDRAIASRQSSKV